jgi:hypothetical protein
MFHDRFEEYRNEGAEEHLCRHAALNFLAHEDVALKAYFESRNRNLEGVPCRAVFNQIGEALPTIILGGRVIGTRKWNPIRMRIEWSFIPGRVPKALGTRRDQQGRIAFRVFPTGVQHCIYSLGAHDSRQVGRSGFWSWEAC